MTDSRKIVRAYRSYPNQKLAWLVLHDKEGFFVVDMGNKKREHWGPYPDEMSAVSTITFNADNDLQEVDTKTAEMLLHPGDDFVPGIWAKKITEEYYNYAVLSNLTN